jgi:hypothetical protein
MVLPKITIGQESKMDHPRSMQMLKFICLETAICGQQDANHKSKEKTQKNKNGNNPGPFC